MTTMHDAIPLGVTLRSYESNDTTDAVSHLDLHDATLSDALDFAHAAARQGHVVEANPVRSGAYYQVAGGENKNEPYEVTDLLEWVVEELRDLALWDANAALLYELNWNATTGRTGRYYRIENAMDYIGASDASELALLGMEAHNDFLSTEHDWIAWKDDTAYFLTQEQYENVCELLLQQFTEEAIEDIVSWLYDAEESATISWQAPDNPVRMEEQ